MSPLLPEQTPESDALRARFARVAMRSAPVPQAVFVRGEGAYVWDADGRRFLDFLAGIAVNSLGHAHPALVDAVAEQAARLIHVSNYVTTPQGIAFAERLVRLTGAGETGRVYPANSGAEAIEAAVKLARRTGRPRIIAFENGFHGRTMGALAVTGKPALRAPFEPMLPGAEHIPTNLAALEAAMGDDVAAVLLEPIKGEAGVMPLPEGFLTAARELTTRHGALLIADEIQTGAGRTGDWFATQHEGVIPDAWVLAKGIGGGVPVGALVTTGAASDLFTLGQHGSTFGGNPLATGAADAVLAEIERADLVGNARRRGDELRAGILGLGSPLVTEVRGRGLLLGVGLAGEVAQRVVDEAMRRGLIVNAPNATTIRLAPPLIIGDAEIAEFLTLFAESLEAAS
ncbi:acetylornithine aminotransferase [Microcella putealis]|uniref:Acetylornithine aminotransferase n=1 Tax=Microcella putealis TaxID=337005 RepID=A0A4Q7LSN3_9MICO|nr:acetylornithine transaminase [Microcella putealis]RZS57684.1 acetylornithine aminotransferase [Microcella putealis]TQM24751.1 acetylornithine aminotransferase [Microcella putealis]